MFKHLNDRLIIYTRRNKTESNYLSNFIEWCEGFDTRSHKPENLIDIINLLKINRNIKKFEINCKSTSRYTGGSVASVEMTISNKAFKIPIIGFVQNYKPEELDIHEAANYATKLENKIGLEISMNASAI